jgi:hypothetical protein
MAVLVALVFVGTNFVVVTPGRMLQGPTTRARCRGRAGRTDVTDRIVLRAVLLCSEQFELIRIALGAVLVVPWHFPVDTAVAGEPSWA